MNANRSTRRISRPSRDNGFAYSQQSVFVAMDRFVKAVNDMHSTVLVPSRLLDIEVDNENNEMSGFLPANLDSTDLYSFFTMSKDVQNELLWGPAMDIPVPCPAPIHLSSSGISSPSNLSVPKYVRQFSDNSQKSDCDFDSVFTDQDNVDRQSSSSHRNNIASAFRHHLLGLRTILHQLADTADFLSSTYQNEIESSTT